MVQFSSRALSRLLADLDGINTLDGLVGWRFQQAPNLGRNTYDGIIDAIERLPDLPPCSEGFPARVRFRLKFQGGKTYEGTFPRELSIDGEHGTHPGAIRYHIIGVNEEVLISPPGWSLD